MLLVTLQNPAYKKFEGKRMNEVIQAIGKPPIDVLFELLEQNAADSVPTLVYFHHNEEDMKFALRQPFVSIGSDGTAWLIEVRSPMRQSASPLVRHVSPLLGKYVQEKSSSSSHRKMTSENTAKIRSLRPRSLLRPGQWADVTVFDPKRNRPRHLQKAPPVFDRCRSI